jgi:hypothetical protein
VYHQVSKGGESNWRRAYFFPSCLGNFRLAAFSNEKEKCISRREPLGCISRRIMCGHCRPLGHDDTTTRTHTYCRQCTYYYTYSYRRNTPSFIISPPRLFLFFSFSSFSCLQTVLVASIHSFPLVLLLFVSYTCFDIPQTQKKRTRACFACPLFSFYYYTLCIAPCVSQKKG